MSSEIPNLILQNRLLAEEVKRRVDQISAINMVAATVGQSLDLDQTLETALQAVAGVVGAEAAGISLIDETAGDVVLRAQLGWVQDFVVSNPMRIPFGQGMSGLVISSDDVVVDNDLDGTEEYAVPSFKKEHFRSIAMAPMHARGKIIGILSIMSHQPDRFDKDLIDVLRPIADTVGVAIDNARLYESYVEQANRLAAILQSTADGIIATDQTSRISLVNEAAEVILEIDAQHLLGVRLREADAMPLLMRDQLLFALSSRTQEERKSFQVTLDNERIVSVTVLPVYVEKLVDQEHDPDIWVIVLRDVTHLREAEIARAQFIQAAAHDVRNPLGATRSALKMLEEILEGGDETVMEIIGIALNSTRRLEGLIDSLFEIEQIETGRALQPTSVDIRELCHALLGEIKPMALEKGISPEIQISDDAPSHLSLDRNWFSRALFNYLENAVKYTQSGGSILLRVYVQMPMVHFEVIDNGPGIPAGAQPRLFEQFYRAEETQEIRGTGLGLAIVKSVAEAHGGSVYVRSKKGDGSTFGIAIPLRDHAR